MGKRNGSGPIVLNADDLQEYQLRLRMLAQARATATLIEDGVKLWMDTTARRYKQRGRVSIDPATGQFTSVEAGGG
jgi:hypothetical protein